MMAYEAKGREVWDMNTTNHNGPEGRAIDRQFCVMSEGLENPEAAAKALADMLNAPRNRA